MSGVPPFTMVPARAIGDKELSAADLRVLMVIAYHDRGKNGLGCFRDARKLGEMAAVDPSHWARHTARLEKQSYIKIERVSTDRRKRRYFVLRGEGLDSDLNEQTDTGSTKCHANELATNGDDRIEILAKRTAEQFDNAEKPDRQTEKQTKRSRETVFTDEPGKPDLAKPATDKVSRRVRVDKFDGERGFNMEIVLTMLQPVMSRTEATRFVMKSYQLAMDEELDERQAGEAVAKAVKAWKTKGFQDVAWRKLLTWSIKLQRIPKSEQTKHL